MVERVYIIEDVKNHPEGYEYLWLNCIDFTGTKEGASMYREFENYC